jgi:twitching motility protein PilI
MTRNDQHNGASQSLLGFESGGENWLIDIADAGEVLPVPKLFNVPLTKSWFLGVANIRGTLYGVTDLAVFHGGASTVIRSQSRLLLARTQSHNSAASNIALLMAASYGVNPGVKADLKIELDAGLKSLAEAHNVQTCVQPWRGELYRDKDGQAWTHLLLPKLVNAAEFLDIAA